MARKVNLQTVKGVVVSGLGCASQYLKVQLPVLSQMFPELSGVNPSTINVQLEKGLGVVNADFRVRPMPHINPILNEFFDFFRISFRWGKRTIPAWIYRTSGSIHRLNPCHIEIIAPFIEENRPEPGDKVEVTFQAPVKKLEMISVG